MPAHNFSLPLNVELVHAALDGDPNRVLFLLSLGADPLGFIPMGGASALMAAARGRRFPHNFNDFSTESMAAQQQTADTLSAGHLACVRILAPISDANATENFLHRNALMSSLYIGNNLAVFEILAPLTNLGAVDDNGDSALTLAAAFGRPDALSVLMAIPGIPRHDGEGASSLLLAARSQIRKESSSPQDDLYFQCVQMILADASFAEDAWRKTDTRRILPSIIAGGNVRVFSAIWRAIPEPKRAESIQLLPLLFISAFESGNLQLGHAIAELFPEARREKLFQQALSDAIDSHPARISVVRSLANEQRCRRLGPELQTPLALAVNVDPINLEVVKELIGKSDVLQVGLLALTALEIAITTEAEAGDGIESVQEAIRMLASAESCRKRGPTGKTPLMLAIEEEISPASIEALCRASDLSATHPHGKGLLAIAVATCSDRTEVLEKLLSFEHPASSYSQALAASIGLGLLPMVKLLIPLADQGALNHLGQASFLQAVSANQPSILQLLGPESLPHQEDLAYRDAFDIAFGLGGEANIKAMMVRAIIDAIDVSQIPDFDYVVARLQDHAIHDLGDAVEDLVAHLMSKREALELSRITPQQAISRPRKTL